MVEQSQEEVLFGTREKDGWKWFKNRNEKTNVKYVGVLQGVKLS